MDESNEKPESLITERHDRVRKLYRYVNDVARRIDEAHASSRATADIFTTYIEVQRQKLKDNCEKLMFLDLTNYGKKALELVWRKVYYETISTTKKQSDFEDQANIYLYSHIMSGIGHFHSLISRIQSECRFHFKEIDFSYAYEDYENESGSCNDTATQLIVRGLLHSCLIYLGDLSRYQNEIFHAFNSSNSARYYLQAAHIDLASGMPYNQLGNLFLEKNYNLDSVCYYIHCLNCAEPFDGALENLSKLFEKNSQFVEILANSETLTQTEQIQCTVVQFLSLIELWFMGKNDTDIPQRCNHIAQELKISMEFNQLPLDVSNSDHDDCNQALEEESINPTYLSASTIHKLVLICLFTITKLNETDEKKAFACKAFTLALFSQLLQKLLKQIKILGFKNPADKFKQPVLHAKENVVPEEIHINDMETITENGIQEKQNQGEQGFTKSIIQDEINDEKTPVKEKSPEKVVGKKIAKRRRRRRVSSSESSGHSDDDDESSNSLSDCEGDSVSSNDGNIPNMSDDSDENSDISDDNNDPKEPVKENGESNHKDKESPPKVLQINQLPNGIKINGTVSTEDKLVTNQIPEGFNEIGIQHFLRGDNILPSIKVLTDWLLTEKDLILSCGDSGESLFQCIIDLYNILIHHFKPENLDKCCKILDYAQSVAKNLELEFKTIPLPEDVNLRGTNICRFDKDAAEWQILNRYNPSVYEENVIRILYFVDFGDQIAKIVPKIRLNRPMQILYLKKSAPQKLHRGPKGTHKRAREWHNTKKATQSEGGENALLHRLGRLWLASKVRELERYGRSAATPTLLALDAAALHKHLRRVKQLLKARSFVLLIPTVVLQELDDLKREESSARDAIRWLELQLQSGSRFVRAQRPGQSRPLPLLKYPRKAPPHVHNFIQVLEFCHHFVGDEAAHGGNGDPDNTIQGKSAPLLILLTGNDLDKVADNYKEFSVTGAAKSAGITIEFFGGFYSKWKSSAPKSGKKR